MDETNKKSPRDSQTHELDITSLICPMTFVRTKLTLESLPVGDVLAVTLRGEEPLSNVPRSATQHGHTVLSVDAGEGDTHIVLIRKENI